MPNKTAVMSYLLMTSRISDFENNASNEFGTLSERNNFHNMATGLIMACKILADEFKLDDGKMQEIYDDHCKRSRNQVSSG